MDQEIRKKNSAENHPIVFSKRMVSAEFSVNTEMSHVKQTGMVYQVNVLLKINVIASPRVVFLPTPKVSLLTPCVTAAAFETNHFFFIASFPFT